MEIKIGEEFVTRDGCVWVIEEYANASNVIARPKGYGFSKRTTYAQLKKGQIKNPYNPTLYNVGFFGIGDYSRRNHNKAYNAWKNMISRCYNKNDKKYKSYGMLGVTVNDDFKCFQSFAKWFESNTIDIDDVLSLDKDILSKEGKIYSPETCCLIPNSLNSSMNNLSRIGVHWNKSHKKWVSVVVCSVREKRSVSKDFDCFGMAVMNNKRDKAMAIKEYADFYFSKGQISSNIYNHMIKKYCNVK